MTGICMSLRTSFFIVHCVFYKYTIGINQVFQFWDYHRYLLHQFWLYCNIVLQSSLSMSRISLSQSMTDLCRSTENLTLATSGWDIESKNIELQEQLEAKR